MKNLANFKPLESACSNILDALIILFAANSFQVRKCGCSTLQTHPCNENRVFPVYFFSQGKTCNENRFCLVWEKYTEITLCGIAVHENVDA